MPRGVSAPPGLFLSTLGYYCKPKWLSTDVYSLAVTPTVRTEDLIDAQAIANMLGLAQRNTISLYQRRYPDMPRPVVDLGKGRCRLWRRSEIERWAKQRSR